MPKLKTCIGQFILCRVGGTEW